MPRTNRKYRLCECTCYALRQVDVPLLSTYYVAHTLRGAFVIQFSQPPTIFESRSYSHFTQKGTEAKRKKECTQGQVASL